MAKHPATFFIEEAKERRAEARNEAVRICRRDLPFIRSRGVSFCFSDENGLIDKYEYIDLTCKDLEEYIREVADRNPGKKLTFALEGGFDGARTLEDFDYGDYEPWVTEWSGSEFDSEFKLVKGG